METDIFTKLRISPLNKENNPLFFTAMIKNSEINISMILVFLSIIFKAKTWKPYPFFKDWGQEYLENKVVSNYFFKIKFLFVDRNKNIQGKIMASNLSKVIHTFEQCSEIERTAIFTWNHSKHTQLCNCTLFPFFLDLKNLFRLYRIHWTIAVNIIGQFQCCMAKYCE